MKKKAETKYGNAYFCQSCQRAARNEKQRVKAFNDLFSTAVSGIRQPIKSFFNWLNEKTTVQRAQKIISTAGLLIHIMRKIAVAVIYLIS